MSETTDKDADKVLREGNVEITTHDGNPAIKIGDELLELRTNISVEDESRVTGSRTVDSTTETDTDDYTWWTVYRDETDGEIEYPSVCIEPVVVDGV